MELLEQNQSLTDQLATLATRVAQLKEQKCRGFRNSSQPPSSDGHGQRRSGFSSSGSGQGEDQRGHPSHSRDLLPSDLCDEVIDHHPDQCSSCGSSLTRLNWAPKTDPTLIRASLPTRLAKEKHHEAHATGLSRSSASSASPRADVKDGQYVTDVCRALEVSTANYHR